MVWHRTLAFVQIMKFFNQFHGFLLIMLLVGNWDQNCVKLDHRVSSEALTCKWLLASTKTSCVYCDKQSKCRCKSPVDSLTYRIEKCTLYIPALRIFSSSRLLGFLSKLSKKIPGNFKEGSWKVSEKSFLAWTSVWTLEIFYWCKFCVITLYSLCCVSF